MCARNLLHNMIVLCLQDLQTSTVYNWEGVRLYSVASLRDNKTVLAADSHKRVRSYNFEDYTDQTICEEENQIINMTLSSDEKFCLLTLAKQVGLLMTRLLGLNSRHLGVFIHDFLDSL